jgi:hypothetical protein
MSSRTSHRRAAAGKKSRQEKNIFQAKKSQPVRFPDKNGRDDEKSFSGWAACEKCFGYSLLENGLCWSCTFGGAS